MEKNVEYQVYYLGPYPDTFYSEQEALDYAQRMTECVHHKITVVKVEKTEIFSIDDNSPMRVDKKTEK